MVVWPDFLNHQRYGITPIFTHQIKWTSVEDCKLSWTVTMTWYRCTGPKPMVKWAEPYQNYVARNRAMKVFSNIQSYVFTLYLPLKLMYTNMTFLFTCILLLVSLSIISKKDQFIYHIICFQQGSISCLISTFLHATWAVVVFAGRFSRQRWIWRGSLRILNRQINSVGGITCEGFCCRRFEVRGSTAVFYIVCLHLVYINCCMLYIYIYTFVCWLLAQFFSNM